MFESKFNFFEGVEVFSFWYAACQIIGLSVLLMMLSWSLYYQGGMAWRWSPLESNVHPFMMTLGFIYLMSNSLMIYRGFKSMSKMKLKVVHATLHVLTLVCVIIGLTAMWDYHTLMHMKNLTSLHSWIGLLTVILFVIQWTYSFMVFLFPGADLHIRNKCMNPHVFLGITIFILANVSALLGLFQESLWGAGMSQVFANILGLFMILFAGLVVYILTKTEFKRLDYHM